MSTLAFTPTTSKALASSKALTSNRESDERRNGLKIIRLRDDLSRVTLPSGEVLGYVERFEHPQGERFRAKRFLARQRRFVEIGEFWNRADATDCFRIA